MTDISGPAATTPRARYDADLATGRTLPDAAQAAALDALERLHGELVGAPACAPLGLLDRLRGRRAPTWRAVRGLYLWGPVGRGKTYLVDTFCDSLPFAERTRIHFHSFMRKVREALEQLRDTPDPLVHVATAWAREHRVLCLDEFHVGDITDAMLLATLIEALLAEGVTLIATSNERPSELYAGGLQRERFLPAIALIERELEVCELAGAQDYRLRALEQAPVYYRAAPGQSNAALERGFCALASGPAQLGGELLVEGRAIPTVRQAEGVAWFEFAALCQSARSTVDYIEIARCHHSVLISDVPVFGPDDNDAARRFINFIDEIYDRNVNLIVSAAEEPEGLYRGGRLAKPFLRTASRLREMRSHDYLAKPHMSD